MLDIQIEEMIEKYKSTVYSVALTHTRSKFDADDVFQDVFLAYYKKQPCFKDAEHAKAWFIKTTVNLCKKIYNTSLWKKAVSIDEVKEEQFSFADPRENELFDHIRKMPPKLRNLRQMRVRKQPNPLYKMRPQRVLKLLPMLQLPPLKPVWKAEKLLQR